MYLKLELYNILSLSGKGREVIKVRCIRSIDDILEIRFRIESNNFMEGNRNW